MSTWRRLLPIGRGAVDRPFQYGTAPDLERRIARLERSQWRSPGEIERRQVRLRTKAVLRAWDRIPFYRKLWSGAGLKRRDLADPAGFASLPPVTKEDLQRSLSEMTDPRADLGRADLVTTGGTTGQPVGLWQDREVLWWEEAFVWRHWRWFGVAFGDRAAVCRGIRPPNGGAIGLDPRLGLVLSGFDLSWRSAAGYLEALARHRPAFLRGYPSTLLLLARRALADGVAFEGIKAVFTSSELLVPSARETIGRAFRAPVSDLYGHAERAVAAGECPAGRLHVFPEYGFLEIDAGGAGRQGEILATSFRNRATVLVRYRTGDAGRLTGEECPCGRAMPVLAIEQGRAQDFLVTPEGRLVSATAINFHSRVFDGIERFRFVQDDPRSVVFEYAPLPGAPPPDEPAIEADLRAKLGTSLALRFERRDAIPPASSGKHRFIISSLDPDRLGEEEGDRS